MTGTLKKTRVALAAVTFLCAGCPGGEVNTEADAELAYVGFDPILSHIMDLGFAGFNAAGSANIPTQEDDAPGDGTIAVDGQVDQGNSDNKGMRLDVALDDYFDGPVDSPAADDETAYEIVYSTADGAPLDCDLQLKNFPDGTLEGTVSGTVVMTGDLTGDLVLDLAIDGETDPDADDAEKVTRAAGTTQVTGTATSDYGEYAVDVEI